MTKILPPEPIDPTLDDFCYLMSLVIKEVNPGINREIAHDMLLEMIEAQTLTEPDAMQVGRLIRATVKIAERESLH